MPKDHCARPHCVGCDEGVCAWCGHGDCPAPDCGEECPAPGENARCAGCPGCGTEDADPADDYDDRFDEDLDDDPEEPSDGVGPKERAAR